MLEKHLQAGSIAECLHSFVPRAGDCLFLPAGTVHAVGGGVLMAEVQQTSDATFRLFDWNRLGPDGQPRKLHIEESLKSINWLAGPVQPITPRPLTHSPAGIHGERLVSCQYFQVDRFRVRGLFPVPYPGELSIWLVLGGTAELQSQQTGYRRELHPGETILIPASAPGVSWLALSEAVLVAIRTEAS